MARGCRRGAPRHHAASSSAKRFIGSSPFDAQLCLFGRGARRVRLALARTHPSLLLGPER